jgi:ferrous iron transport protein B
MAKKKYIKVALVGNPNSGKTSLFNQLTGLKQKIGNYPGITVDKKTGVCSLKEGKKASVIDLPGTYSIYPRSDDERVVFETVYDLNPITKPDVAIAIVDAVNLKRNLLLFTQIHDMGIPVILALNMMDVADRSGIKINLEKIEKAMNVPVVGINARTGDGINKIKELLTSVPSTKKHKPFYDVKNFTPELIDEVKSEFKLKNNYQAYLIIHQYKHVHQLSVAQKEFIESLIDKYDFNINSAQAKETIDRYSIINEFIDGSIKVKLDGHQFRFTDKIDSILTHKIWGYLIFMVILMAIFQSIFAWAEYPMDFIDRSISNLSLVLKSKFPEGPFFALITDGILPGIGGILMFVPQIMLLFLFIAILEETGYMARVVFLMDKLMRQFGLNGRSVVPLISGMACAIPAIMATRSIDNWKDRLITIFVIPLVSCSARLPVFTILIAMAVPEVRILGIFNLQGLTLMALYLLGFVVAVLSALIIRQFVVRKGKSFLIMELPLYKWPRLYNVLITIFEKTKSFVWEAGRIILAISIVLWVLASYGPSDKLKNAEKTISEKYAGENLSDKQLNTKVASYKLEHSYAGVIGKAIEPAIKPIGFDWKIGIALITSFAAREVFVGTMATIYSIEQADAETTIRTKMQNEIKPETGGPRYTTAVAFSLIIFYAFAMQCMSTLAIVLRETKAWKWPLLQLLYLSTLAYVASLITYTILK